MDRGDRPPHFVAPWVRPEQVEQVQRIHRGDSPGKEGAATPPPVGVLGGEELGTPALACHPGALSGDLVGWCIGQVAHHLPADGGIRVEQPIDHGHARIMLSERAVWDSNPRLED